MNANQKELLGWAIMATAGINTFISICALGGSTILVIIFGCYRKRKLANKKDDIEKRLMHHNHVMFQHAGNLLWFREEYKARLWCLTWEPDREWCLKHSIDCSEWEEEITY